MEISQLLKGRQLTRGERQKGEPRNYRQALIKEILENVNPGRIKGGYKALTHVGLEARYTGGISDFDLGWLLQESKKKENFSKFFFGRLKLKKNV